MNKNLKIKKNYIGGYPPGDQELRTGQEYERRPDYERARDYYEIAARNGNHEALIHLGWLYQNGLGVEQNYETARRYYERAAALDNELALINLGNLYQNGLGVEQNHEMARGYYDRADMVGNPHRPPPVEQPPPLELFPEDELKDFVERFRCLVCKVNAVNMVINECNHLICNSCYDNLQIPKRCPNCERTPITVHRIFYGGYKQKYLKYKNKYLKLKNYKLL